MILFFFVLLTFLPFSSAQSCSAGVCRSESSCLSSGRLYTTASPGCSAGQVCCYATSVRCDSGDGACMLNTACSSMGNTPVSGLCRNWGSNILCCRASAAPTPVNCAVSSWSSWGSCDRDCDGTGTQSRTRSITRSPANGGTACPSLTSTQACTNGCAPCAVSAFSDWSQCNRACGGGVSSRTRSVTRQPTCGCAACPGALEETRNCNRQACPVNCELSQWGSFGPCQAPCGPSTQVRTRQIVTQGANGGRLCSTNAAEYNDERSCNQGACSCSTSNWSNWSACNKLCGGGKMSRNRRITESGPSCPNLSEARDCNTQACSQPSPAATPSPTPAPVPGQVPKTITTFNTAIPAGTANADGSVTVRFDMDVLADAGTFREVTLTLPTSLGRVDLQTQKSDGALERVTTGVVESSDGDKIVLVFSSPMQIVEMEFSGFDAGETGELLYDANLKRELKVAPINAAKQSFATATAQGHTSYTIDPLIHKFGLQAFTAKPVTSNPGSGQGPVAQGPGGVRSPVVLVPQGVSNQSPAASSGGSPGVENDLPWLWIVLAVLACVIIILAVVFCVLAVRKRRNNIVYQSDVYMPHGPPSQGQSYNLQGNMQGESYPHGYSSSMGAPAYSTSMAGSVNAPMGGSVRPAYPQMGTYNDIPGAPSQGQGYQKSPSSGSVHSAGYPTFSGVSGAGSSADIYHATGYQSARDAHPSSPPGVRPVYPQTGSYGDSTPGGYAGGDTTELGRHIQSQR